MTLFHAVPNFAITVPRAKDPRAIASMVILENYATNSTVPLLVLADNVLVQTHADAPVLDSKGLCAKFQTVLSLVRTMEHV